MDESDSFTLLIESDVPQHFAISPSQDSYCLQSSDGKNLAILHSRTTISLQTLRDLPSIRLEAVIGGEATDKTERKCKKGKITVLSISINIYGSEKVIQDVGKRLSKAHLYLQHPTNLKSDVPYKNPHFYAAPGVRNESGLYISPSCRKKEQQDSVLDIAKVFEEVDHSRKLPSQCADWNIRTPLLEYDSFPDCMIGY